MAEKKTRVKRKDIRKQRWAAFIAGLLALAMAISAIAAYSGHLLDPGRGEQANPGQEVDPDAAREICLGEIERLQKYISEIGPTVPVLGELVRYYAALIQLEAGGGKASEETLQGYRDDLLEACRDLIELEPDQPLHRLQLLNYYQEFEEGEDAIDGEIEALRLLLHENPEPSAALMLIGFLKNLEEQAAIMEEEIDWLKAHLEQLDAEEKMNSEERYYYAYLLGQYIEDTGAATEQLNAILEQESEESNLYGAAKSYLEQLEKQGENGSGEEK